VRLVQALLDAGLPWIELTSFVSPRWIPALADNAEVARIFAAPVKGQTSALVPNLRGLEGAIEAGMGACAVFISASETHNLKNINRPIDVALESYIEVIAQARAAGLKVRGYLSMVWGCPWEGNVPVAQVIRLTRALLEAGCYEVSLGDTVGYGTPRQTRDLLLALEGEGVGLSQVAMHMHDTRGMALANCVVGLDLGVRTFDGAVGGLGGCPYAKGASGNLATEDLVYMLDGMGVHTGVDLDKLVDAALLAEALVGRPLPGRYFRAIAGSARA